MVALDDGDPERRYLALRAYREENEPKAWSRQWSITEEKFLFRGSLICKKMQHHCVCGKCM